MKTFLALLLTVCVTLTFHSVEAQVIPDTPPGTIVFQDDFETGNLSKWTPTSAATPSPFTMESPRNFVPLNGMNSAKMTSATNRMHRNLIADNGGKEVRGRVIFTSYIFDPGETTLPDVITGGYLDSFYNEIRGYSGTGLPNGGTAANGGLVQLLAIGKFNTVTMPGEGYNTNKYQGRVTFGNIAGWLNLDGPNSPNRSIGWHKFVIERLEDGSTVNFYVDNVLSRTVYGATASSFDTLMMGPGLTRTNTGAVFMDGLSVSYFPDVTPPTLTYAYGSFNHREVTVSFSEEVNATAEVPGNYALNFGVQVIEAKRLTRNSVKLLTTIQKPGQSYELTVNGVQDAGETPNALAANSKISFKALPPSRFFTDFTGEVPGTSLAGHARIEAGVLKLTTAIDSQNGAFFVNNFDGNEKVLGFTASFRMKVGSGNGADGFSFNFATDLPGIMAEEGGGTGLSICFDTYNNMADEAPSVKIKSGGVLVTSKRVGVLRTGNAFVDVFINVSSTGELDLIYNGQTVFSKLSVYNTKLTGASFAFGARTGGLVDDHWVDDLQIGTIPENADSVRPRLLSANATASKINLVFSEPIADYPSAELASYSLSPEHQISTVQLSQDRTRITLNTSSNMSETISYNLSIKDLTDRATSPNLLIPNPTLVSFMAVIHRPLDVGQPVTGFQDDFRGTQRNSLWVPHGPAGDVYDQGTIEGSLFVTYSTNESILPNHLLLEAPSYDPVNQEILARVRVLNFLPGTGGLGGVGAAVAGGDSPPESEGLNFTFENVPGTGRSATFYDDSIGQGQPHPGTWQTNAFYWIRMKNELDMVSGKIWEADGNNAEPETWEIWNHVNTRSGFAGITASFNNKPFEFEVDYILIKAAGLGTITANPDYFQSGVPVCESLVIQQTLEGYKIIWDGTCVLQSSAEVSGPYGDVPNNPISPYSVDTNEPQRFFRLRRP